MSKLSDAEGVLRTARANLRIWEEGGGDAENALKVRRCLGQMAQLLDDLENELLGLEMEQKMTEKEFLRHKSKLSDLSQERKKITLALAQDPPKKRLMEVSVNLSNQEARQLQKVSEREQEALLEDLGGSLVRI